MTTERLKVNGRRLGLKTPKKAPALRVERLLVSGVPGHPSAVDRLGGVDSWGLYHNDRFGVCGPVSVANYVRLVSHHLLGARIDLSDEAVYDLYRRSGNPGFNPETGEDDNGVDMQTMLEALLREGIGGLKPVAFAAVDPQNIDAIRACVSIFGGVLFGAMLSVAQNRQMDSGLPFQYVPGSPPWGGHAVVAGRYLPAPPPENDPRDVGIVTWGAVVDTTDAFVWNQLMEAWVVIWPWHLDHPAFQEGVDLQGLREDYEALTGRVLDVPTIPVPVTPLPEDPQLPDEVLAEQANEWLRHRHVGINHDFALAVREWLAKKGLMMDDLPDPAAE